MDHPDTWRLIVNGPERVVGYWHFAPLFDIEFDKEMKGELADDQITTDIVQVFELPGLYNVYFTALSIREPFRRPSTLRLLFRSLADVLPALAREEVFIGRVCANAYTGYGQSLCKGLGLKFVTEHKDHGQVFAAELVDLLNHDLLKAHSELRKLYGLDIADRRLRVSVR